MPGISSLQPMLQHPSSPKHAQSHTQAAAPAHLQPLREDGQLAALGLAGVACGRGMGQHQQGVVGRLGTTCRKSKSGRHWQPAQQSSQSHLPRPQYRRASRCSSASGTRPAPGAQSCCEERGGRRGEQGRPGRPAGVCRDPRAIECARISGQSHAAGRHPPPKLTRNTPLLIAPCSQQHILLSSSSGCVRAKPTPTDPG